MAIIYSRWTEDELQADIERLGKQIAETRQRTGQGSRCAIAYLTQVLRDRRESLASLLGEKRRHFN